MIARVANGIVEGLKQQPFMLVIVVLNCVAIAAAFVFLDRLVMVGDRRMELILRSCLPQYPSPTKPEEPP
jgi:hypothetical protein